MKVKLLAVLMGALLTYGCAFPGFPGRQRFKGDNVIVPGERIGGISVGMSIADARAEATARFGKMDAEQDCTEQEENERWVCVFEKGVKGPRYGETPGFVFSTGTGDPVFRTAEGLGVGSAGFQFTQQYGGPDRIVPIGGRVVVDWYDEGLFIVVDVGGGNVIAVGIYKVIKPGE